jgi:hypothetical protein
MEQRETLARMKLYQATALFSVLFALVGFSYNVWRLEITEENNNVRAAAFESLLQLAELEQLVYAAHYDQDEEAGNPRVGWVKVGLIKDLSLICSTPIQEAASSLRDTWKDNWQAMPQQRSAADAIVNAIDDSRRALQSALADLD